MGIVFHSHRVLLCQGVEGPLLCTEMSKAQFFSYRRTESDRCRHCPQNPHTYLGFEKRIQFHKYIWKGKSLPRKKTKAGDRGVCGSDSGLALGDRGRKGGAKRACWHGDQAPELRLLSGELGNVDCSGSAPGHPKEVDWSCA